MPTIDLTDQEWLMLRRTRGMDMTGFPCHSVTDSDLYYFWCWGLQPEDWELDRLTHTDPLEAAKKFLTFYEKGGVRPILRKVEPPSLARKFKLGDVVRKTKGSEWEGVVVGAYSTSLTPEGYCVESRAHAGSVQIYPASALGLK